MGLEILNKQAASYNDNFFYKLNIPTDAGTMATEVIKKKVRKLILKMCINTIVIFPRYFTE